MKLADKNPALLTKLIDVSIIASIVLGVSTAVGRLADLHEKRSRTTAEWMATVRRLCECPGGDLPRLSALADDDLGVTATGYTLRQAAPNRAAHGRGDGADQQRRVVARQRGDGCSTKMDDGLGQRGAMAPIGRPRTDCGAGPREWPETRTIGQ
jgi:hypothetical protein